MCPKLSGNAWNRHGHVENTRGRRIGVTLAATVALAVPAAADAAWPVDFGSSGGSASSAARAPTICPVPAPRERVVSGSRGRMTAERLFATAFPDSVGRTAMQYPA